MRPMSQIQEQERRATSSKYWIVEQVIAYCILPVFILLALIIGAAWTEFKATAPFLLWFFEGCIVLAVTSWLIGFIIRSYQKQKRLAELQWYKRLAELDLEQYKRLAELDPEQYKQQIYRYYPNSTGNYAAYFDTERERLGTFRQPERVNVIQPVPHTWIPIYSPTTVNEEQQPDLTPKHVLHTMPTRAGSTNGHQPTRAGSTNGHH